MTTWAAAPIIDGVLTGRRLVHHRFYRRWVDGAVSRSELAAYAGQYRHFEAYLPGFLASLAGQLPDGAAKRLVTANLADELGDPVSHVELFERFASAVGADPSDPSPAMTALLSTYAGLLAEGPVPALAGFVAYEAQASEVAAAKADGLRRHYSCDGDAVRFWEHHAEVDNVHRAWAFEALDEMTGGAGAGDAATAGARRAAVAWWAFLDEREAARALAPSA